MKIPVFVINLEVDLDRLKMVEDQIRQYNFALNSREWTRVLQRWNLV